MSISILYSLPGLRLREMAERRGSFPPCGGNPEGGSYELKGRSAGAVPEQEQSVC